MQRLTETECDVIELLQKAQPERVNKGSLMIDIGRRSDLINRCLDGLVRKNYITEIKDNGFVYYIISDVNKQLKIRKVKCPKCSYVRRIFGDEQTIAICKNRECRTPAGTRTVYWVVRRSVKFQNGEVEYLNQA